MKKNKLKKIILYSISSLLLLVVVLAAHIYWVYRPKAPTVNSRIMVRIDIKQSINLNDVNHIKVFMAHESGVDHYLVNPETRIVIFTYSPLKISGNQVVDDFKNTFGFKAQRFIPSATDLKSSCPVSGSSYTYKVYKIISQII